MAISPEFNYENEDQFIQKFIIPLLQRLGFSLVINYHGTSEFGKDLIFAELDRFGHIRYHGLQAKYIPSISLNNIEELVLDCKQAFSNPFNHPQTGTTEKISSFYAVNGGSIGPEAVEHYFNSLLSLYGGNARLLQGKDLVTLDRWASGNRTDNVIDIINGLLIEMNYNNIVESLWTNFFQKNLDGKDVGFPIENFRNVAFSAYLIKPILQNFIDTASMLRYSTYLDNCKHQFEIITQGIIPPDNRQKLMTKSLNDLSKLNNLAKSILSSLQNTLAKLGPLTKL